MLDRISVLGTAPSFWVAPEWLGVELKLENERSDSFCVVPGFGSAGV